MPRYIDADELIKVLWEIHDNYKGTWLASAYTMEHDAIKAVEKMPTADVAEVVRCKECVFHSDSFILNGKRKCNIFCMCTEDGFYCGFGEKMDEVSE